ncbi:MAG: redox-sensing transcriptional repressor Rex [Clostridia bacterium]|nr:redox-sensing transcriptional repressor Rex [Clostridia bacterium]
MNRYVPISTLRRLPVYLHYVRSIKGERKNVSAAVIAEFFGLNPVQVRKDLAAVSGTGKPKTGYDVEELICQIESCLDCNNETKSVLIGAGNLGSALLSYNGFSDYGINIVAAFDTDPETVGKSIGGKPVLPLSDLESICRFSKIRLGIITVPAGSAQEICDRLVSCGITAVWNFAPTILKAKDGVLIENENLASSLAILSRHLLFER